MHINRHKQFAQLEKLREQLNVKYSADSDRAQIVENTAETGTAEDTGQESTIANGQIPESGQLTGEKNGTSNSASADFSGERTGIMTLNNSSLSYSSPSDSYI